MDYSIRRDIAKQMYTDLTPEQKALADCMSDISERCFGADWMDGLEYDLWNALLHGERKYGQGMISANDIENLKRISNACNCWIYFDDKQEETAIALERWRERCQYLQVLPRTKMSTFINKTALTFSGIALSGLLLLWLLGGLLLKTIPGTPFKLDGLLITVIYLSCIIAVQKRVLRADPGTSIIRLIILGVLVSLLAEASFQIIRQFTFQDYSLSERARYFFTGVISITLLMAVYSFFSAYQLKTRRTARLFLFIGIFLAIIAVIKHFFPSPFQ
ncbi:hypothetical protein [Hufsiella ginkgonis]|uniref:Uncharacterized protein n=1 Tax=Hufsiella ginkgonis TaxID=2695274 RepID=A0A7K1XTM7_9SPHI|nr:hypothetical protein [Hufsiella ginkgonis]MXV14324.1 hypothetical protein [Hufsiella ginkgonis]